MEQTRLETMLEVAVNYLTGFTIGFLLFKYVVIPNDFINQSALLTTSLFTVTSVIRSYAWRRFFNRGLHKYIKVLVQNYYQKS